MNYNLIKLNLILIILISILPCRSQNWGGLDEAEKRIEKYRKADFIISIKDKNGNGVKDVDIQIDMKRHAFLFGAEVKAGLLYGPYANEKYKQTFLEFFNGGILASNTQGSFQGRGFLGQYEIKIKHKKTIVNQTFDLGKDGHTLTFILP
jgi:hypothetical protein